MPRRSTGEAMVPMHLKVPRDLRAWYEAEAVRRTAETGEVVRHTQVVRQALEEYRRQHNVLAGHSRSARGDPQPGS